MIHGEIAERVQCSLALGEDGGEGWVPKRFVQTDVASASEIVLDLWEALDCFRGRSFGLGAIVGIAELILSSMVE